jgi:hypothetical protein
MTRRSLACTPLLAVMLLLGCGGGSGGEAAPTASPSAMTPSTPAASAASAPEAASAPVAASEPASVAGPEADPAGLAVGTTPAQPKPAATGSTAASGTASGSEPPTVATAPAEGVLGSPVDSSTETAPTVGTLAATVGCKVNEQRRFGACRAHASLGLSHGETVSFANLTPGYQGSITASCSNGAVQWSAGLCTAVAQTSAQRSLPGLPDLVNKKLFVASPPYAVLTRHGVKSVTLAPYPSKSQVPRTHDFVDAFIDPTTKRPNALSLQSAHAEAGGVVHRNFYENSVPVFGPQGAPGRAEKRSEGLRMAYLPNDPPSGDRLRTQINSYALPTRTPLTWDLSLRFGGPGEPWPVRPFTTSPVLIWQIIQFSSGFPPIGLIVDTDPADNSKIFLTVFQRGSNVAAYSQRWTLNGLEPGRFHDIVIQATLDDRDPAEGGIGQLRVWVNGQLVAQRDGRNLMKEVNDVHRWAFGVYQTNEPKPINLTRATTWRRARLLVDR